MCARRLVPASTNSKVNADRINARSICEIFTAMLVGLKLTMTSSVVSVQPQRRNNSNITDAKGDFPLRACGVAQGYSGVLIFLYSASHSNVDAILAHWMAQLQWNGIIHTTYYSSSKYPKK